MEKQTVSIPGDPKRVLGHLRWAITETATGATLGQGDRDLLLGEVKADSIDSEMGKLVHYSIPLSDGFNISVATSPDDQTGFGFSAENTQQASFSWEWFQVNGQIATKLQETGELKVAIEKGSLARAEFLTDVSVRIVPMDAAADPQNPKWRILIAKGSHFEIPR